MSCVRVIPFLSCMILLAGCGSDGGSPDQDLDDALSLVDAEYVVLDLSSKRLFGLASAPDLSGDEVRSTHMVFRRVPAGPVTVGSDPASLGNQSDESPQTTLPVATCYLALFECSQGQWQRLAGSSPWSALAGDLISQAAVKSACNLSLDAVGDALAAYNSGLGNGSLRLPTETEWERAVRLDSPATDYSYGDNRIAAPPTVATIASHAWTFETAGGDTGPFRIGSKQATAHGFTDLHGNVWEWTADGTVRGGSWRDQALQSRSANRLTLDPDLPHPLVGCRLALSLR